MLAINKPIVQFSLAAITVVALPLFLKSGILASEVLIYALIAAACNLLLGYTGLLSFGQGIFFGLGSYVAGIFLVRYGVPVWAVLFMATLLGAAVATIVGWLSIRRQGVYFVMLTLAFSQLFYFLAYTFSDITGGDNGLMDVPRPYFGGHQLNNAWSYYIFVAASFLTLFALMLQATQSTFGRTLIAVRDNEERAAAIGFPVKAFKTAAFAISGAVTAYAGALKAMLIGVAPLANIEHHTSEMILIMTIIGGATSLYGSVLGAAAYMILADELSQIWPRWLLLLGVALICVALFLQKGIWGLVEKLWVLVTERNKPQSARENEGAEQ